MHYLNGALGTIDIAVSVMFNNKHNLAGPPAELLLRGFRQFMGYVARAVRRGAIGFRSFVVRVLDNLSAEFPRTSWLFGRMKSVFNLFSG